MGDDNGAGLRVLVGDVDRGQKRLPVGCLHVLAVDLRHISKLGVHCI